MMILKLLNKVKILINNNQIMMRMKKIYKYKNNNHLKIEKNFWKKFFIIFFKSFSKFYKLKVKS